MALFIPPFMEFLSLEFLMVWSIRGGQADPARPHLSRMRYAESLQWCTHLSHSTYLDGHDGLPQPWHDRARDGLIIAPFFATTALEQQASHRPRWILWLL